MSDPMTVGRCRAEQAPQVHPPPRCRTRVALRRARRDRAKSAENPLLLAVCSANPAGLDQPPVFRTGG